MLSINVERDNDTAVLHCAGEIVVGSELSILRDAVLCALDQRAIVLDLAGVDRIDAAGLGMLLFLHTCTHGLGTEMRLLAPGGLVAAVLRLTRLDSVFTVSAPAEAATEVAPLPAAVPCQLCA
jgi:anti-anti-sigma factor